MIIEAIKDGDRYILPIKGKKDKIKVEILNEDAFEDTSDYTINNDSIEEAVALHYEEKRKNSIDETIDMEIFKKFLRINNLEDR